MNADMRGRLTEKIRFLAVTYGSSGNSKKTRVIDQKMSSSKVNGTLRRSREKLAHGAVLQPAGPVTQARDGVQSRLVPQGARLGEVGHDGNVTVCSKLTGCCDNDALMGGTCNGFEGSVRISKRENDMRTRGTKIQMLVASDDSCRRLMREKMMSEGSAASFKHISKNMDGTSGNPKVDCMKLTDIENRQMTPSSEKLPRRHDMLSKASETGKLNSPYVKTTNPASKRISDKRVIRPPYSFVTQKKARINSGSKSKMIEREANVVAHRPIQTMQRCTVGGLDPRHNGVEDVVMGKESISTEKSNIVRSSTVSNEQVKKTTTESCGPGQVHGAKEKAMVESTIDKSNQRTEIIQKLPTFSGGLSSSKGGSTGDTGNQRNSVSLTLPAKPHLILQRHGETLSKYEHIEIYKYDKIWCWGAEAKKVKSNMSRPKENFGYDDPNGDYNIVVGDHLAYRYKITKVLGRGTFGQVIEALDYKYNKLTAIKIIGNDPEFNQQANKEVELLSKLRKENSCASDERGNSNIVQVDKWFIFRKHKCISFELLSNSIYDFMRMTNFRPFPLKIIRVVAIQLLYALKYLFQRNIIHCDLKPENVLFKYHNRCGIKLIDFGASCYKDETMYQYIQSRFYRAPEVILGLPYNTAIDMWSLGCLLVEMLTGTPLFPGANELDQMAKIIGICGYPPPHMVRGSKRFNTFFRNYRGQYQFLRTIPYMGAEFGAHHSREIGLENSSSIEYSMNNGLNDGVHMNNLSTGSLRRPPRHMMNIPAGMMSEEENVRRAHGHGKILHPIEDQEEYSDRNIDMLVKSQDPQFNNFLKMCLQLDPAKRLTPAKALQHPWITQYTQT